ncbi:unnamed protein product [Adineta steineri]|uniref:NAD(P)(+)--arginine ADP-ribosyltransferase n=1 Tax=Adineta steineri TaxID=433720 RepID=A0A815I4K2_9BILA|nr:unnamed protein product [Adineta steineri]
MGNCESPTDDLTLNESAAIYMYTLEFDSGEHSLYRVLNQTLCGESRSALEPWLPYLKLFLTALNKLPSYQGFVYRAVKENKSNTYRPGKTRMWWSFMSATTNVSMVEELIGQQGSRTVFSIECKNGKCIAAHSSFPMEDEIILLPGFYFEVRSHIELPDELRLIQIREIASPLDLY